METNREDYHLIRGVGYVGKTFLKLDERVFKVAQNAELDIHNWRASKEGELTNISPWEARKLLHQLDSQAPNIREYALIMSFLQLKDPFQYAKITGADGSFPTSEILDGLWKPKENGTAVFVNRNGVFEVPFPQDHERYVHFGFKDISRQTGLPVRLGPKSPQRPFVLSLGKETGCDYDLWGIGKEVAMENYTPVDDMMTGGKDIRVREIKTNMPSKVRGYSFEDLKEI